MRLLHLGPEGGTSRLRVEALRRLGHEVHVITPSRLLGASRWVAVWTIHAGGIGLDPLLARRITAELLGRYDCVLVDGGDVVGRATLQRLRDVSPVVVNYCQDNPFTPRDRRRWRILKSVLPLYDLYCTPRESNIEPAYAGGARRVYRFWFSADEREHAPSPGWPEAVERGVGIVFVGAWMPERGPLMAELHRRALPLRIYGPRWHRAPEYQQFRTCVNEGNFDTKAYRDIVASSAVALCLLSKGNEDLYTTRSLELPAMGAVMCAERTSVHEALYRDGEEALFWSSSAECADLCQRMLDDPAARRRIAEAARRRALANDRFNEREMRDLLEAALG